MDVAAVRQAVADAVAEIDGIEAFGYRPESAPTPCFYTDSVERVYDLAARRGLDQLTLTCMILVSRQDDKASQSKLDGYLAGSGSGSVKAALIAARGAPGELALDGAADDLRLVRAYDYGLQEVGGTQYLGVTLEIIVWGRGAA